MTWYVARAAGAVAVDTSEAYGLSVAIGLDELCSAVSTAGELVVGASAAGVSAVVRLAELCELASRGGDLVVFPSALGVSAVVRLGELCETVSRGAELAAGAPAVAGVREVATDTLFVSCVMARITNTNTTPDNSAIVPKENRFAREACVGSGGGTGVDSGGAPHEGQAVANELTSFPQS